MVRGSEKRHHICYRKSTRVGQAVSSDALENIEEFHKSFVQLYEKHQYPMNAMVNIDEIGLNFDAVSSYTLDFKVRYFCKL